MSLSLKSHILAASPAALFFLPLLLPRFGLLVPQLLFCGYFVRIADLPNAMGWLQWIMPLTYTFRLAVMEELMASNCSNDVDGVCYSFLQNMRSTVDYKQQYWLTLIGMVIIIRCLAVSFLHAKLDKMPSMLSSSASLSRT